MSVCKVCGKLGHTPPENLVVLTIKTTASFLVMSLGLSFYCAELKQCFNIIGRGCSFRPHSQAWNKASHNCTWDMTAHGPLVSYVHSQN